MNIFIIFMFLFLIFLSFTTFFLNWLRFIISSVCGNLFQKFDDRLKVSLMLHLPLLCRFLKHDIFYETSRLQFVSLFFRDPCVLCCYSCCAWKEMLSSWRMTTTNHVKIPFIKTFSVSCIRKRCLYLSLRIHIFVANNDTVRRNSRKMVFTWFIILYICFRLVLFEQDQQIALSRIRCFGIFAYVWYK